MLSPWAICFLICASSHIINSIIMGEHEPETSAWEKFGIFIFAICPFNFLWAFCTPLTTIHAFKIAKEGKQRKESEGKRKQQKKTESSSKSESLLLRCDRFLKSL